MDNDHWHHQRSIQAQLNGSAYIGTKTPRASIAHCTVGAFYFLNESLIYDKIIQI